MRPSAPPAAPWLSPSIRQAGGSQERSEANTSNHKPVVTRTKTRSQLISIQPSVWMFNVRLISTLAGDFESYKSSG